ncbi:MAG: response regulator [Oscillospiraceae bacterium]|nr:response regulator [Oscillospiraceae bacterium]
MEINRDTVVIVDDDGVSRTIAKNCLSGRFNFFDAPSVEAMFEILDNVTPSLILLDVDMPGMNGFEIIKKLKSDKKTMTIPVIFVTGKIDPVSEIEGLSLGAVDYIMKPYTKELLIKRVELHIALAAGHAVSAMNERLTLMLDTSPLCAQIWDRNLNTIDCNDAGVRLYGFENKAEYAERFLQECSPEFQPDGQRSDVKAIKLVHKAFNDGYCVFYWMHRIPATDTPVPAEVTLVKATYGGEDVVIGYTRDLREQHDMTLKIEYAKKLSSALAEITKSQTLSAGDLKAAADFITITGCKVLDVSRISIWTISENEDALINLSCYETSISKHIHEDDFDLLDREEYKNLLFNERLIVTSNVRESVEIDDGYNPQICAMLEAPIRLDGKFVGLVCADQDCCDKYSNKREWSIEEQNFVSSLSDLMALAISGIQRQNAREEAQAASKAKGDFLANMNHEIRTPMNVIVGLTELLLEGGNTVETERAYLQKINAAGSTLVSLINDVLDISKIEAGKFSLSLTQYELASLLNDVVVLSIIRIGDKPITFHLEIGDDLPSILYGDDLRIKQILINLLSNAFKYTRKGTVTLRVGCSREEGINDVLLSFSVIDTGIGMCAEDVDKLFADYNQVDTRANRMIEGTGLGLAIAKGFAELMDGTITVESEYGKGSVFEVSIRQSFIGEETIDSKTLDDLRNFRYEDSKISNERQLVRPDLSGVNVLVVDDSPTNLDVAGVLLGKYNMRVDCVLNGHDAIDRMRLGEPVYNAIFMDHMMPGMDGIETAKWIRKIDTEYAREIPIIALTANAVAGNERMFLDEGFQAFVSKPINIKKLDTVIRTWIIKDAATPPEYLVETENIASSSQREPVPQQHSEQDTSAIEVDIPGVNATLGLSLYEDDMDMYMDILKSFVYNIPTEIERLRNVSKESLTGYAINIHTMKSASASIGAKSLSKKAKNLERMAKEGDLEGIMTDNEAFIKDAVTLVDDVRTWLDKELVL